VSRIFSLLASVFRAPYENATYDAPMTIAITSSAAASFIQFEDIFRAAIFHHPSELNHAKSHLPSIQAP
jgi:hypothetical protein